MSFDWGKGIAEGAAAGFGLFGDKQDDMLAKVMSIFKKSQQRTTNLYGQARDDYQSGLQAIMAGFGHAEQIAKNAKSSARQMVLGQEADLLGDAQQNLVGSGNIAAYDVARGSIGYGTSKALVDIDSQLAQILGNISAEGGLAIAGQHNVMGHSLESLSGEKNQLSIANVNALSNTQDQGGFDFAGIAASLAALF